MGVPEDMRPQTQELDTEELKSSAAKSPVAHDGTPKQKQGNTKLTPEKLRELKAKYPNIDWEHDNGLDGVEGLASQPTVDTTTPALMTPKQWAALRQKPGEKG